MTQQQEHYSTLLTPAGSGAIALIRVTGPKPVEIVGQVFQPANRKQMGHEAPNKLVYGWINHHNEPIDDVIISNQPQAHPPFVDISTHAGIRIVERVLAALAEVGAPLLEKKTPPAWPCHSVIEQESLNMMQHAKSKKAAAWSMRLHAQLQPHLMQLTNRIQHEPEQVRQSLDQLVAGYRHACLLLNGVSIALIGPPNSGKSTLFNRLLGRPAAIVHNLAGTTRDWIVGEVEIEGIPVTLIDTAGRHSTKDHLENVAIAKGKRIISHVDGCILVVDASLSNSQQSADVYLGGDVSIPTVIALNKCDVAKSQNGRRSSNKEPVITTFHNLDIPSVSCSAVTQEGIASLMQTLFSTLGVYSATEHVISLFTQRQIDVSQKILELLSHSPRLAAKALVEELIHPINPN